MPAQLQQQCLYNNSNDASATTLMAHHHNNGNASAIRGNDSKGTIATTAMRPVKQQQRRQCNDVDSAIATTATNASAMMAKTPT